MEPWTWLAAAGGPWMGVLAAQESPPGEGLPPLVRAVLSVAFHPFYTFIWLLVPMVLAFGVLTEVSPREERQREELRAWWRTRKRETAFTLLVLFVLFYIHPTAGATGLLLASAAALLRVLAQLRAAGFDGRRDLGRRCALFSMMLALLFGGVSRYVVGITPLWIDLAWSAVAAGAIATGFLALAAAHRSLWAFLTRCDGIEAALGFGVLFLLVYLPMVVAVPIYTGVALSEVLGQRPGWIAGLEPPRARWVVGDLLFVASSCLLAAIAVAATWRAPRGELPRVDLPRPGR